MAQDLAHRAETTCAVAAANRSCTYRSDASSLACRRRRRRARNWQLHARSQSSTGRRHWEAESVGQRRWLDGGGREDLALTNRWRWRRPRNWQLHARSRGSMGRRHREAESAGQCRRLDGGGRGDLALVVCGRGGQD